MAVLFWYLVKCDLSSVHVYSRVHWISHFFYKVSKKAAMLVLSVCIQGGPYEYTGWIIRTKTSIADPFD